MIDEWPREEFDARLREAERVVVLFYADWCPFSRTFLPVFERADEDCSVPMARANLRHPMDPRWDEYRIHTVPTVLYFEHGEELERLDGVRRLGLTERALAGFVANVEDLQQRFVKRHGRMQIDRFG